MIALAAALVGVLAITPALLAKQPAWVPVPRTEEAEVIGGPWAGEGPGPSENGQVEGIPNLPVTGAVNALAPHPTDPSVLYLGAVSGGLWKTTNATAANPNWTPLTDTLTSLSTGNSSFRFDPTDPTSATLVAGIGQSSSFGAGGPILGLLRTTDGGSSFVLLDGGGVLTGKNMSGVAARGAILVAAARTPAPALANIGIFRSTDTGVTFGQVSGTGGLAQGRSFGLAEDPSNGAVLYTAIRDAGVNNGVYKSSDTGATWARVSDAAIDALFHDASPTTTNVKLSVGAANNPYIACQRREAGRAVPLR